MRKYCVCSAMANLALKSMAVESSKPVALHEFTYDYGYGDDDDDDDDALLFVTRGFVYRIVYYLS